MSGILWVIIVGFVAGIIARLLSPGPNKSISPGDLAKALGADQIDNLASQSGLSRDELLSGLSQHLPDVINHLTPDGRLPTENELSGRI